MELDKIETLKHPSASVNPANQLLVVSGKIVEGIKFSLFNLIFPFKAHLLNPSTYFLNDSCLDPGRRPGTGNIKFPLNKFFI